MRNLAFSVAYSLLGSLIITCNAFATVSWDDVFYSTGPYRGWQKKAWGKMTEEQKVYYLERYRNEINYCLGNIGKNVKVLDPKMSCDMGGGDVPASYYAIALKYKHYGDQRKAAEYYHKDWLDSISNPNWEPFSGDADEIGVVIFGYERAGMYKEALPFYEKAYGKLIGDLKAGTDSKLLQNNFKEYKKNWPDQAESYLSFMRKWDKAKKLAETSKPRSLDPAVQYHEWFYSDKQEEVLKALEYYYNNKVRFILEKALKRNDQVIATKAKEYLNTLGKVEENEKAFK